MQYDLDTGAHSTYSLHYHLILVIKNRCEVYNKELRDIFPEVVNGFVGNYGVVIKNREADRDQFAPLFKIASTTDLAKFIDVLEGASARRIRNECGDQIKDKRRVDSFCTDSYCLIDTGQVSLDVLKGYAENQWERDAE